MRTGTAGRWAVVCLVAGATVMGCNCDDGTRLKTTPPDKTLRVESSDVVSCDGQRVRLEPLVFGGKPPYEFHWEPAAHVSSPDSVSTMADAEDTRTYTLTVTDSQGWSVSSQTKVEHRGAPKVALKIASGRALGCEGESVTLDASESRAFDGTPLATFEWDMGDGQPPAASATQTSAMFAPKDGQTVSLKVTDAAGCVATAQVPLKVRAPPKPAVRFTQGSGAVCSGTKVALDGADSKDAEGKPVASFAWNLDGDAATVESTSAASGAFVPGGAPAVLTVTDDLGCAASLTAAIAVKPLPTARIKLGQAGSLVCAGAPVALDGSDSTDASGAPVVAYAWDFDKDGTLDSTDVKPLPFAAAGPRAVRLTVTDSQGCSNDRSFDIVPRGAPQLPVAVASGRTDGCFGDELTLSAAGAVDADGNPVASYQWDVNGDGTVDGTSATMVTHLATKVTAKVTVVDQQGCSAESTIALAPHQLPTAVAEFATGSGSVCSGEQVVLDGSKSRDENGAPVAAYAWDLDGNPATVDGTGARTAAWSPSGSPAKLTVTDAHGCSASAVVPITVRGRPQAVIAASRSGTDVCLGSMVTLDGTGSKAADGTSALQFAWELDGNPATVDSTAAKPPALLVDRPNTAKLTVTDVDGCTAEATVAFDPRANPVVPPILLSGDPTGCAGDQVHLSAAGAVDADGNPIRTFAWDLDGNGTTDSTADSADVTLAGAQTVSVKAIDTKGCFTTSATTLTPRALPTPKVAFAVGAATVCAGSEVALDASSSVDADGQPVTSYAWDLDGDPSSLEGESAITGRFVPTGIPAHLTVADRRGCKASLDTALAVQQRPTADIAFRQGSSAVCDGTTIAVDGSGSKDASGNPVAKYAWDFDSTPSTTESTLAQPPPFVTAGGRDVRLTVTDATGCTGERVIRLTSRTLPKPVVSIVQGRADACLGDAVQLSAAGSLDVDGQPVTAYRWDYAEAGSATTVTQETTSPFVPASSELVSVTVTDSYGCRATATQALAPRPLPTPLVDFTKGGPSTCSGDLVSLDGGASHDADGNPVSTYAWDLDGDTSTIESSGVGSGSFDPRSGPATLTVTDVMGCRASLTKNVAVNALPVARIGWSVGAALVCDGSRVVLDGSGSSDALGSPVAAYAWELDGNAATVEGTAATAPAFTASGAKTVRLTVTDANGCQSSTTATTSTRGLPTARIALSGTNAQICSGDQVTVNGSGSTDVDGHPVAAYAWDLDGNAASTESTLAQPPSMPVSGAKTVALVVTDSFGCKANASTTITPRALPVPKISFVSGRADVCAGGTVSLTSAGSVDADGASVTRVTWDVQSDGMIDASTVQTPPFVPGGNQTVKLVVTDAVGCTASTTQQVTPRALPMADIRFAQGASLVCSGAQVQFDGSNSKDADGALPATLAWDTNSDGVTDQTGTTTTAWSPASATMVALRVTDRLGCTSSTSKSVSVRALPTARVTFTQGSAAVCSGSTVQVNGGTSTDANGAAVASYAWDLDGTASTIESTAAAPAAFALDSSRTATLTVTDAQGCTGKVSQLLTANPNPVVTAGADAAFCAGGSATLGGAAASGTTYAWSPATGLSSTTVSNPKATPSVTTVYQVTARNTYGCTAKDDVTVSVWPLPVVDAGPDRSVALGGSVALLATASGGTAPLSYAWTQASTLSSATALQPRASPSSDTRYDLNVTDAHACTATDYLYVEVLPPMTVTVGPDMRLCRDSGKALPVTAKVTSGVAPFTYAWTSSPDCGGCIAGATTATASVTPVTDTTFTVTVTDANGNTATDSMNVHPIDRITVDAGPDRSVPRGGTTQLGGPGDPQITYSWTCSRTSCGLSDYSVSNPIAQPDGTTAYTVVATDGPTCYAQDTVLVTGEPTIIATVPVEGFDPWSRDAPIFVIFDTDMDAASFLGNVSLLDPGDGGNIWITTSYDPATRMLIVSPQDSCGGGCTGDHRYWNNRPYLLTLKGGNGGIRSAGVYGTPLYNDMTLEFVVSSMGDGSPPQLVYRQPAWGAVGVMTSTEIVMKFDEPEDPRSVNANTIWIAGIPGTVSYDPRTWTATLRLSRPLSPNTAYVVNVVGVKDGAGNPTGTSWTFTTGPSADTTPPSVVSSNPVNGAPAVDVASILSITFSEPIDTATLGRLKVSDVTAGAPISGKVLYDEATRTATFEPKSFLEPLHQFRIDLAGITDQAGNALPTWTCNFTAAPVLVAERFESLPVGWNFQSPWALDFQAARAGATGLSDSPGTRYANSATRIATSPALNVGGKSAVSVSLWTRRTIDTNNDTAYVDYSPDGTTWTTASTLLGPTGWRTHTVSVPTNGRARLYVRLRLVSDSSVNLDGWFVDDFVVR